MQIVWDGTLCHCAGGNTPLPPNILMNCSAFIFVVKQSKKDADPEDDGTVIL